VETAETVYGVGSCPTVPGQDTTNAPSCWPEYEVFPTSPWNYAIDPDSAAVKTRHDVPAGQPWTPDSAPIELLAVGRRIPEWRMTDNMVDPLPASPVVSGEPLEELTLIPMGCARLRISCFPALAKQNTCMDSYH
jgi:hypothetical protein